MSGKTAVIVGATGLVGRELLNVLLEHDYYSKVLLVGRRSPEVKDNRIEEVVVDFNRLSDYKSQISANDYYCCIGTTMGKAKNKETFFKVDFSFPMELAKMAKEDPQFEVFNVVTSYGANPESGLFYNAVKGQLEDALRDLNLKTLHIYQPSLLLGYRPHFRLWEELAKIVSSVFSFFIIGSRLRFWAIKGREVAEAMFYVSKSGESGVHVHKPLEMKKTSRRKEYKVDTTIAASA
ncbi:NAD-dependent epimerase/dehydratase family protein [Reichenbachiella versicolor]|uniref:NAD-dependent epimerase/dehydratase family protein n=1 Tax=Reichenbachiella versicolor TaxID=1821036 RepID=UPI000D6E428E|nr:NAD-dependent epimerase/dehydratase family protein [Reichenbachiella versicolor]